MGLYAIALMRVIAVYKPVPRMVVVHQDRLVPKQRFPLSKDGLVCLKASSVRLLRVSLSKTVVLVRPVAMGTVRPHVLRAAQHFVFHVKRTRTATPQGNRERFALGHKATRLVPNLAVMRTFAPVAFRVSNPTGVSQNSVFLWMGSVASRVWTIRLVLRGMLARSMFARAKKAERKEISAIPCLVVRAFLALLLQRGNVVFNLVGRPRGALERLVFLMVRAKGRPCVKV